MEMWFKTDNKAIRLPVLPSELNVSNSNLVNSVNILREGEVSLYGGSNLRTGEISSFFPRRNYSFNEYTNVENQFSLALQFKNWCNSGQLVRFIVTDAKSSININLVVRITEFEYSAKDGTGDIYYTLKWKEYRPIIISKIQNTNNSTNNNKQNTSTQDKNTNKQKTHTVKKGDCLWDIAQKYYGKGSQYPKIKTANSTKYPSLKKNNIIYVNWVLTIP